MFLNIAPPIFKRIRGKKHQRKNAVEIHTFCALHIERTKFFLNFPMTMCVLLKLLDISSASQIMS